jgi:hypothetical protein
MNKFTHYLAASFVIILPAFGRAFSPSDAPTGAAAISASSADEVKFHEQNGSCTLANEYISLMFDLVKRSYSVTDVRTGEVVLQNCQIGSDQWEAYLTNAHRIASKQEKVADERGKGIRLTLTVVSDRKDVPTCLFNYTLYEGSGMLVMGFGLNNNCEHDIQFKMTSPLTRAKLLSGKTLDNPQTLNGSAGSEPAMVSPGVKRDSPNSLMLTGMIDGKRRTLVWGGLAYQEFAAYAQVKDGVLQVEASDPVGRLVKPGETYWAGDTLYLEVTTSNPFIALEQYGLAMRQANHARPNVYNFPVLCGWSVGAMSHLDDVNTSEKLVQELDAAQKAGLTKYTKVGIRLEPDTYCYQDHGNTEQGWWDDAHWAKYGHLVPPYETFAKWCTAIREREGVPYTYFQVGMPSDDYARAFPDHILSKDISRLGIKHNHHQPLVSYDYTSADFQKRTLAMWQRLRQDGIRGIKFDYPETGWRPEGGFEDKKATTASAYRKAFQLCRAGLGDDAFIDERNLGETGRPCLDVTAGIVDTQRNWTDSNGYVPEMVTIGGLRWYKNRTVFNYFPDTKTVHDCSPEIRQSMLTMIFLTSGRIDLATSFKLFTPEITHDFSRIFPVYRDPRTARPVDAFTGVTNPQVYDLMLTPDWHQVAFYNTQGKPGVVSAALSGENMSGAIGLDSSATYYAYDFWSDKLLGKLSGTAKLEKELNPNCCAMISLRKVEPNPQVLSTNRHVLQGWVELSQVKWDEKTKKLFGIAKVIGGDPFKLVVADNGKKSVGVTLAAADSADGVTADLQEAAGLTHVTFKSQENRDVAWSVQFAEQP